MGLLTPSLSHPTQEIRLTAIDLVTQITKVVGNSAMDVYLDQIRPAVMESLRTRKVEVAGSKEPQNKRTSVVLPHIKETESTVSHLPKEDSEFGFRLLTPKVLPNICSLPVTPKEEDAPFDKEIDSLNSSPSNLKQKVPLSESTDVSEQKSVIEAPQKDFTLEPLVANTASVLLACKKSPIRLLKNYLDDGSESSTPVEVSKELTKLEFFPSSPRDVKKIPAKERKKRMQAFLGSI